MYAQFMQDNLQPDQGEESTIRNDRGGNFRFGAFTARPAARDLSCNGEPIDIGSRAFDLLVILLRSQGAIVSKDEIFRYVWPSTTVDESNLRFQMTTLRKALGAERTRIKTIPGRGYLFIADEPRSEGAERNESAHGTSVVQRPSIVIIDSDPENREALHRLLRPFHALIQSFSSKEAFMLSTSFEHDGIPT